MADNPVLDRLSGFAAQPATRQLSLLTGFAASVALAVGLVNWASTPSYEPVYGAMSPADNATAINVLQTSGIKYRMEPGTGLLEVPYDDVLQARMALASEGFPRNGGGIGFESLYEEQQMGLSSFMEQARYHRAVEAELSRTIAAMDSVSGARVHLAIAKQSAFMRRGNQPSASVMVNLLPGVRLSERQLAGIIHLVASSIPNLDSDRVSVVDQAGKLLSSQGEDSDFGYTAEQFRLAQQFENSLNDRIMAILEPILGVGAVRAQVTADMDFTRVESTNEIYDPTTVLRSEQTTQDVTNRSTGTATNAGALAAQPPQQGALEAADQQQVVDNIPDRESLKETRNYEVNKTISHTRRVPGTIQKLSVAVVVDYAADENGERIPLDQARIDQITALVREAIGFSAERGDTVQVINSPFIAPAPIEPIPEPGFLEQAWVWELGRGLMAAAAVLALIFAVLRPMIRYSTTYAPPVAAAPSRLENAMAEAGATGEPLALGGPDDTPAPPPKPNYHQSVAMARNTAVEQPVRAAYVVKNWIAADG